MAKKIANVCGIFVAIVLSVILLLMLMLTPIISGVTTLVQGKTLHKLVENIDFTEFIPEPEGNSTDPTVNAMFELVETEFFVECVNLYVSDLLAALEGEQPDNLTLDALNGLKEEHREELTEVMHNMLLAVDGVSEELVTDQIVQERLDEMYDELIPALVEQLPTLEEIGVEQEVLDGLILLRDKTIKMAFIAVIVVVSLLILVCRWPRFKGFIWLAVVYILSCPVVLLERSFMDGIGSSILTDELADLTQVLELILASLKHSMIIGAVVYMVLAVIFVVIAVLGRKMLKKKGSLDI